jgi:Uma2 family endonuclease
MALTVGDRAVRPLTADEVLRMLAAGILTDDNRVELLDGVLTEKPAKSPAHEAVKSRLIDWLRPGWDSRAYLVRIEAPLVVRDRLALPEPDIAIVEPREYLADHPRTAMLVIEVAVTSLEIDTVVKPPVYAGAGVSEYWVVDVAHRRVEVFSDPTPDRGYRHRRIVEPPATLAPAAPAGLRLDLGALVDGL